MFKFKINDNIEVDVSGVESMMFAELVYNFSQMVGLKEDNKTTFTFNSKPIKADSNRTLSEIGITSNSVINVKTERPLDYNPQNTGNSGTPNTQNNSTSTETSTNNSGNMNQNMNVNPNVSYGGMYMNPVSYGSMYMNPVSYGGMYMNPNMNM